MLLHAVEIKTHLVQMLKESVSVNCEVIMWYPWAIRLSSNFKTRRENLGQFCCWVTVFALQPHSLFSSYKLNCNISSINSSTVNENMHKSLTRFGVARGGCKSRTSSVQVKHSHWRREMGGHENFWLLLKPRPLPLITCHKQNLKFRLCYPRRPPKTQSGIDA